MGRPLTHTDIEELENSFKNRNVNFKASFLILITIAIVPQLVFFVLRYFHQ